MGELTRADAKRRMDELVAEINRNDHLYYVEARPVIADADYDRMYEELLALEKAYPAFRDPNSPTLRVSGAPLTGFAPVRHDPPMKSLDKCYAMLAETHNNREADDAVIENTRQTLIKLGLEEAPKEEEPSAFMQGLTKFLKKLNDRVYDTFGAAGFRDKFFK